MMGCASRAATIMRFQVPYRRLFCHAAIGDRQRANRGKREGGSGTFTGTWSNWIENCAHSQQEQFDKLNEQRETIIRQLEELKVKLYEKFGSNINLEYDAQEEDA